MKTQRWPVMVKLHDADLKEHVFGPITVELPAIENAENIGDWWRRVENEALKYLQPDMSCDVLEGLMHSKKEP